MTSAIQAETRPAAGALRPAAAPLKPQKAKGAAARQKSVAAGGPKPGPPRPARKRRNWPILEAALILVLIKIGAGAFYIWNRPGEAGLGRLEPPRQSRPAWPGGLPEIAGEPLEIAGEPLETPDETMEAAGEAPEAARPDYLAAALRAAQPAQAQAAQAAQASPALASAGALSAGALMVVGGQNAAARITIPLPPDGADLLRPANPSPQAAQFRIGADAGTAPPLVPTTAPGPDFEALRKLQDREMELARREALLSNQASALGSLEEELNQRLRDAETAKRETEAVLQRNEAVLTEQKALAEQQKQEDEALKDARLKHLVTAYTGMKPEQAGSLINSMDDDVAVAILSAMPGGKAGKILAMVNPDKAARLTKAISEKRIDPNMQLQDDEEAAAAATPPI